MPDKVVRFFFFLFPCSEASRTFLADFGTASLSQDRLHRSSRSCRTRQGRSGSGGVARSSSARTQGTRFEGRLALARERWFAPHPHVSRLMSRLSCDGDS